MKIASLELQAPARRLEALRSFYAGSLGLEAIESDAGGLALRAGDGELRFHAAGGSPFYHFAVLVPDGRFDAARRWVEAVTEPLELRDGGTVIDFSDWDARALYFEDPAGNIVEIICHAGIAVSARGPEEPFAARELAGISEAALVAGDPAAKADAIEAETGIGVWDGNAEAGILFSGERGRTLVISRTGRGLMPTHRPGEEHPAVVTLQRDDGSSAVVRVP